MGAGRRTLLGGCAAAQRQNVRGTMRAYVLLVALFGASEACSPDNASSESDAGGTGGSMAQPSNQFLCGGIWTRCTSYGVVREYEGVECLDRQTEVEECEFGCTEDPFPQCVAAPSAGGMGGAGGFGGAQ
jgi:hypothetical protein